MGISAVRTEMAAHSRAPGALVVVRLTSRSSGRVQQQRPASPVRQWWRAAQLQIRYASRVTSIASATRLAHPDSLSATANPCLESRQRPSFFQAINAGSRLRSADVSPAAKGSRRRWWLSRPTGMGRLGGLRMVVIGRHNKSLERTRSASAVRFAGRQLWRAAQLQIR